MRDGAQGPVRIARGTWTCKGESNMYRSLALACCLAAANCDAAELIFMTGTRLQTYCSNVDTDSLDRGLCQGYLTAIVDAATTIQYLRRGHVNICIGADATPFKLRELFMEWAHAHPGQLDGAASGIALEAFAGTYPCH